MAEPDTSITLCCYLLVYIARQMKASWGMIQLQRCDALDVGWTSLSMARYNLATSVVEKFSLSRALCTETGAWCTSHLYYVHLCWVRRQVSSALSHLYWVHLCWVRRQVPGVHLTCIMYTCAVYGDRCLVHYLTCIEYTCAGTVLSAPVLCTETGAWCLSLMKWINNVPS